MEGIKSVEIMVVNLPLGRKFSYLSDGVTRRSCIVSTIKFKNINYKIIEVERDKKSLSTLILFSKLSNIDWKLTVQFIMTNLINNSGRWSKNIFEDLKRKYIFIKKYRHLQKKINDKALDIYLKLNE